MNDVLRTGTRNPTKRRRVPRAPSPHAVDATVHIATRRRRELGTEPHAVDASVHIATPSTRINSRIRRVNDDEALARRRPVLRRRGLRRLHRETNDDHEAPPVERGQEEEE